MSSSPDDSSLRRVALMGVRLKKLSEQVLVITGASSGIGLATARMAAGRGARLVLTARNEEALRRIVGEINAGGGSAVHVAGDGASEEDLRRAAASAIGPCRGGRPWGQHHGGPRF